MSYAAGSLCVDAQDSGSAFEAVMSVLRVWDSTIASVRQHEWAAEVRSLVNERLKAIAAPPLHVTRWPYYHSQQTTHTPGEHMALIQCGLEDLTKVLAGVAHRSGAHYNVMVIDERIGKWHCTCTDALAGMPQALKLGETAIGWAQINRSRKVAMSVAAKQDTEFAELEEAEQIAAAREAFRHLVGDQRQKYPFKNGACLLTCAHVCVYRSTCTCMLQEFARALCSHSSTMTPLLHFLSCCCCHTSFDASARCSQPAGDVSKAALIKDGHTWFPHHVPYKPFDQLDTAQRRAIFDAAVSHEVMDYERLSEAFEKCSKLTCASHIRVQAAMRTKLRRLPGMLPAQNGAGAAAAQAERNESGAAVAGNVHACRVGMHACLQRTAILQKCIHCCKLAWSVRPRRHVGRGVVEIVLMRRLAALLCSS